MKWCWEVVDDLGRKLAERRAFFVAGGEFYREK
jgi:hypothetical protein